MTSLNAPRWPAPAAAFALWGLAAACTAYWGLRLTAPADDERIVPLASAAPAPIADTRAIARLLGATAPSPSVVAAPSLASRFALHGVVARRSGSGAALLAIDGKPARPFAVGAMVEPGLVLQSVAGRQAVLAGSMTGPPVLTLDVPTPAD